jgi:hypothetical protein
VYDMEYAVRILTAAHVAPLALNRNRLSSRWG